MKHRTNTVRRGTAFVALASGCVVITVACAEPSGPHTRSITKAGIAKNIVDPLNPQGTISGISTVSAVGSSATSQTNTLTFASTIGLSGSFTISSNLGAAVSQSLACSLPSSQVCSAPPVFIAGAPACDGFTQKISGSVHASHYAFWVNTQASYFSQAADSYSCPPPPPPPPSIAASGTSNWQDACMYYSDGTAECVDAWDGPPLAAPASGYNVLASLASQSLTTGIGPADNAVTVVASGRVQSGAAATILRRPDIAPHDVIVVDTTQAHPEDLAGALLGIASLRVLHGAVSARSVQGAVGARYLGAEWNNGARTNILAQLLALRTAPQRAVNGIGQVHALDLPAIHRGVTQIRPH